LPNFAFAARTLAEADISAARALYGAKSVTENCCGAINGKLSLFNGKPARDFQVWAEELETGRIIAGVSTGADGSFRIAGLSAGEYQVYSQKIGEKAENSYATEKLGVIEVQKEKQIDLAKKLQNRAEAFSLQYVGFNSQLSELAVPLNSGKSYSIYLGGKNFDADEIDISFSSPFITITPNSLTKPDYGADLSVVSFEIKIAAKTPSGEYGIFVKNKSGKTESLAGSLIIEDSENLQNVNVLTANE
jgi:hypothetical protein